MMFSNNPLFLRNQDFHAKHADMIEAARAEPDSDSRAIAVRKVLYGGAAGGGKSFLLRELASARKLLEEEKIVSDGLRQHKIHLALMNCKQAAELAAAKAEIERLKADIERMGHEAVLDHGETKALMAKLTYSADAEHLWLRPIKPQNDRKIGVQLRIKLPQDYVVSDGPGLHINDAEQMRAANISLRQITEYEPGKL